MPSEFDPSDFVDQDFESGRRTPAVAPAATALPGDPTRAPTREELEARVGTMQNKLSELKRAQQELERERSELEETRRRQSEFTKGRQEMEQHLTRGIGLLEEAEFSARRDAEQMSKTLLDLREALLKVQSIHEETWTRDNLNTELTRALTSIENARMEWNSARLKFTVLNGEVGSPDAAASTPPPSPLEALQQKSYAELCKLGLAITWPIALVGLGLLLVVLLKR
jgi:DNA repair exonuclease SbcCD ATPase subunit